MLWPSSTYAQGSDPRITIADRGESIAWLIPVGIFAVAYMPARRFFDDGRFILIRKLWLDASAAGSISDTVPIGSTFGVLPIETPIFMPLRTNVIADSATVVSSRSGPELSIRTSGTPGDASVPGSAIRPVMVPSNGAAIRV